MTEVTTPYIDPVTGRYVGPSALPSADNALDFQAQHDRAIWDRQQRYMDQAQGLLTDATRFQQGALGLLQSYRPGGSAALEAGIYDRVAGGIQAQAGGAFQRAQMTQPLDLMGRYREQREDEAIRRWERAQERSWIASLVSSGVQLVSAFAGAGSGAATMLPQQRATSLQEYFTAGSEPPGYQPSGQYFASGGASNVGSQGYGGGGASGGGSGGNINGQIQPQGGGQPLAAGIDEPTVSGPNPQLPGGGLPNPLQGGQDAPPMPQGQGGGVGQQQQMRSPFPSGGAGGGAPGMPGGGAGGGAAAPITSPALAGAGRTMPQQGGAQARPGGVAAPASPVGVGPGADRDFSPESFAAYAAADTYDSPLQVMTRVSLNNFVATLYENDSFYRSLPQAIESRWQRSSRAGA